MTLKFILSLSIIIALANAKLDLQSRQERNSDYSNYVEIFQSPECHDENGVCAPDNQCDKQFVHPAEDLCDKEKGHSCCLTTTYYSKKIIQMPKCANLKSICTWEYLCPSKDRHDSKLLCGSQDYVTCCKIDSTENEVENEGKSHRKRTDFRKANNKNILNKRDYENIVNKRTAQEIPNNQRSDIIRSMDGNETPRCVLEYDGICIKTGDCDDIIKGNLCLDPLTKCCKPTNSKLLRNINFDTPIAKREYDENSKMKVPSLRSEIEPRTTGNSCGSSGGECTTEESCGNGFTDNRGLCYGQGMVCCIWTLKHSSG